LARLERTVALRDVDVDSTSGVLKKEAQGVILSHVAGDHTVDSRRISSGGLLGRELSNRLDGLK
jgi:hypothetical protein